MSTSKRSAAGQAAGYHYQIQRALLSILGAPTGGEVSLETLADVALTDAAAGITTLEQLKHSVKPGSLTDRSRPLWNALEAWMDLVDDGRVDDLTTLLLVATHTAPDGSVAALLRDGDGRDASAALHLLLPAAKEDGAADTAVVRGRFLALTPSRPGLPARRRSVLAGKSQMNLRDGLRTAV